MSTLARHLNAEFGFSCQCWLAVDISDRYFGSIYRAWFSTTLNPQLNGSSSNPLIIYQELDRIVHTNDYNHSRIDQYRQRLQHWVGGSALSSAEIALLISEITTAPIPAFRPQLWKIGLHNIHVNRLINLGQFPDEYQIRDLIQTEIEVIAL